MNTTFLSYLLAFCLCLILILYLYQTTEGKKLKNGKNEEHIEYMKKYNNQLQLQLQNNNKLQQKKECMPIHPVGPVHNFHQSFNKYTNMQDVGYPTGIPEMGWRNFYLSNYSNNEVVEEDPFSGIPTRNYLDNLENVKNIYREC